MDTYPAMLNKLFGTKIKVIGGYKAGTDIYLAMERGELDGRCGGAAHRDQGDAAGLADRDARSTCRS